MNCPCCGSSGPCFCSRNRPARPRNTGSSAPVYRRPPRNHSYSCRCAKCGPFYRKRSQFGAEMVLPVFFGAAAVIMGIVWAARHIAHAVAADPAGILIPAFILVAVIVAVVYANKRMTKGPRPPKGRLQVEATTPPLPGSGQGDTTWPVIPGRVREPRR